MLNSVKKHQFGFAINIRKFTKHGSHGMCMSSSKFLGSQISCKSWNKYCLPQRILKSESL